MAATMGENDKILQTSENSNSVEFEMEEDGALQLKTSSKAGQDSYRKQTWKFSICLCIFVVALSAGVLYLLEKHPLFVERGLIRLDHYFSALALNWRTQNRASTEHDAFRYSLLWMAPFFSGGGYCSEAISYVTSMETGSKGTSSIPKLAISHHGDAENMKFWKGLPVATRQTLSSLASTHIDLADAVVVCHSEPGAWYPPLYLTPPCPPTGYEHPRYVVGRTMFETDSVTPHHVDRCNKMDEVWVPTQFHMDTFTRAGVDSEKLVKVVQPVDTDFFNPARLQPLRLPTTNQLFGSDTRPGLHSAKPFVFLSIFKWEHRKGWDILLSAYLQEFSADDEVALHLLTNPYHSDNDFATIITKFVLSRSIREPPRGWPRVYLIDEHIPQSRLSALYKAAACFVLPSRGEGWGRPHVEAMAMELPVIATNWSGMTEYMTERNSYPLRVERMSEVVEGPFKGHLWAEPSTSHLMSLMRHVVAHPKEARQKGMMARVDMVAQYAQEVVGRIVVEQLVRIQAKLDSRTSANKCSSATSRSDHRRFY